MIHVNMKIDVYINKYIYIYVCIHVSKYEVLLLPGAPKVCFFPVSKCFGASQMVKFKYSFLKSFGFVRGQGTLAQTCYTLAQS